MSEQGASVGSGETAQAAGPASKGTPAVAPRAAAVRTWAKRRWPLFALVGGAALAYALTSGALLLHQSAAPHFVYQADAFLRGQLHLAADPPNLNDWVRLGARWYVSFPAFPAVVMLPFVALFGLQLNDVVFTLGFAAANVGLLWLVLRRLAEACDSRRTSREDAVLALAYGFASVAWYCSIRGEVWYTAETLGVTLTCLYLLAAHRARHPVLAGALLALGAATRTPTVFAAPFFFAELLAPNGSLRLDDLRTRRTAILRAVTGFGVAALVCGVPFLALNHARFGEWLEFGHRHLYQNRVNPQIEKYGLFSYQYLERNLHAALTRLPTIASWNPLRLGFDGEGMSLLVTSPFLLFLLWPVERPRLHRALWLTVACVAVPGFFYQNSGYYQFGFRFSLDYMPELMLLLALGGRRLGGWFLAAVAAGVAVNLWGALTFLR